MIDLSLQPGFVDLVKASQFENRWLILFWFIKEKNLFSISSVQISNREAFSTFFSEKWPWNYIFWLWSLNDTIIVLSKLVSHTFSYTFSTFRLLMAPKPKDVKPRVVLVNYVQWAWMTSMPRLVQPVPVTLVPLLLPTMNKMEAGLWLAFLVTELKAVSKACLKSTLKLETTLTGFIQPLVKIVCIISKYIHDLIDNKFKNAS